MKREGRAILQQQSGQSLLICGNDQPFDEERAIKMLAVDFRSGLPALEVCLDIAADSERIGQQFLADCLPQNSLAGEAGDRGRHVE